MHFRTTVLCYIQRKLTFEELHSRTEHTDIVVAVHVAVKTAADTFGVTHLTEYTAVGRCDTFDRHHRAVGVEVYVISGVAVHIHVLCCDLTVCRKLSYDLIGSLLCDLICEFIVNIIFFGFISLGAPTAIQDVITGLALLIIITLTTKVTKGEIVK